MPSINSQKMILFVCQIATDIDDKSTEKLTYNGSRLPMTTFEEIIFNETSGMRLHVWLVI